MLGMKELRPEANSWASRSESSKKHRNASSLAIGAMSTEVAATGFQPEHNQEISSVAQFREVLFHLN